MVLAMASLLAIGAGAVRAADPQGDWNGVLQPVPAMNLRLALHVAKTPAGWSGTLDALDQGALGLALSHVEASDTALDFDVPSVGGHYSGRWDATAKAWAGQWTQGALKAPLVLTAGLPGATPRVEGLDGAWDGAIEAGAGMKLRLRVRISTGPLGTSGSLDSVDQMVRAIPLGEVHRQDGKASFTVPTIGASFEGALGEDGKTLSGTWRQGAGSLALVLTRQAAGAPEAQLARPQTPHPPYPYREEEVFFEDTPAHVRLAGTLTIPAGDGPFPAVVLIAGSGANGRDETIFGHRIFKVLADHLTRRGIAVLRYDKRGVGGSGGDYAMATTADFALDADAAVGFLRTRKDVDPARLGLIGHSEGGLIAPTVALQRPDVSFIVLMAGPGVDGAAILTEQHRLIAKAMGMDDAALAKASADQVRLINIVKAEPDPAAAKAKLKAAADEMAARDGGQPAALEAQAQQLGSPWFHSFFTYDPAPTLRRLRSPVLAMIGSKDLQVSPAQNLPALRAALADDPKAKVVEAPGLNHLFQPATTGSPSEYAGIETTIDPGALEVISDWVLAQTTPR
jgi:pimeloyl-ACP methyl ester carboxylesterase